MLSNDEGFHRCDEGFHRCCSASVRSQSSLLACLPSLWCCVIILKVKVAKRCRLRQYGSQDCLALHTHSVLARQASLRYRETEGKERELKPRPLALHDKSVSLSHPVEVTQREVSLRLESLQAVRCRSDLALSSFFGARRSSQGRWLTLRARRARSAVSLVTHIDQGVFLCSCVLIRSYVP